MGNLHESPVKMLELKKTPDCASFVQTLIKSLSSDYEVFATYAFNCRLALSETNEMN
jgi:hypothetical protein